MGPAALPFSAWGIPILKLTLQSKDNCIGLPTAIDIPLPATLLKSFSTC
jgi:hypothetical protein